MACAFGDNQLNVMIPASAAAAMTAVSDESVGVERDRDGPDITVGSTSPSSVAVDSSGYGSSNKLAALTERTEAGMRGVTTDRLELGSESGSGSPHSPSTVDSELRQKDTPRSKLDRVATESKESSNGSKEGSPNHRHPFAPSAPTQSTHPTNQTDRPARLCATC